MNTNSTSGKFTPTLKLRFDFELCHCMESRGSGVVAVPIRHNYLVVNVENDLLSFSFNVHHSTLS